MLSNGQTEELATLISGAEEKILPLLERWLQQVEDSRDKQKEKEILIRAFHVLGNDHPLTLEYRRKLSRALF
jgi:thioredoxin-like negative regulator of GroEL